ncbi:Segregation and condensation protein B [uncultured Rubrobacteraceae bacterium]|uniref:Segregation and condensation protein B n=1 Tax=uncultured Rubrobacteraceae bacterium TaxID=349277 RepID=A0A6J4P1H0_9ACTN|nr:Segregation and condensation protein B [uncultured Rubrobacteraceae bacterium]
MRERERTSAQVRPEHLLEAVLLVSAGPISPPDLSSATGLSGRETEIALANLMERYAPEGSGIVLRNVGGGYLLSTNPSCSVAVERFREEARPAPLSGAAHEVLACALYLGPLTRGAVSRVRGVNSDAVVRSLIERGLLTEVGTDHDAPGSPALLGLTDEFLAASGASSRDDFPPLSSLVTREELSRVRERLASSGPVPPDAASEPPLAEPS